MYLLIFGLHGVSLCELVRVILHAVAESFESLESGAVLQNPVAHEKTLYANTQTHQSTGTAARCGQFDRFGNWAICIATGRKTATASKTEPVFPYQAGPLTLPSPQAAYALPAAVSRYFWLRLCGLSGMVISTKPVVTAACW